MNTAPLSLLVVEDETTHVKLIRCAFEKADVNVEIRVVGTLREYRASVAERRPDLALIDLKLPDGRGVEVLTQPPTAAPFPSVIMTAFGTQEIAVEIMKAGALDYIVKSVEAFAAMPRTVERALREWNLLQRHQQAEAALREEQALGLILMENLPNYIYFKDTASRFLRVNPALVKLYGMSDPAQVVGKTDADFFQADHARNFLADEQTILRTGQPMVDIEEKLRLRNGNESWVLTTKLPLRDGTGQIIGTCGISTDITARKRAEAELGASNRQLADALTQLRQTQRQFIEQEKLRVLGQMASGIAHDFNNALVPIIGFSELLLKHPEQLAEPAQVLARLQIINTCANDAARVVRQMHDFGRPHVGRDVFQSLDLTKLVRQTIEHTQPRWKDQVQATGQTIQIVTDLRPVLPIRGEEFAIRELLTNLIFNAVDALPAGGTITLGTVVDGEFVRLWVSDTGVGMTEEVRQRCFEPFFTTKGEQGIGLGLAMVQGIVQRHDGLVAVESQLGQGTIVTIRFPIQPGAPN